jgi:BirA family biotin operon repressor/biotin-[acetyl-CoA-carboxylase] ligase
MFDPLPADLAAALSRNASTLGRFAELRFISEAASTNDLALTLAAAGEAEGTSVLADVQHAGRGRRGRTWFSPAGAGLYLSSIVRPKPRPTGMPLVTLGAGVAAAHAVKALTALPVELKWPNDLVIGRPWRKLGGVLSEAAGSGTSIDAVVVGIGINLLQVAYPRDIADRATSIETELGRPIDRTPLVARILESLRTLADQLQGDHGDLICRDWRELARPGLGGAPVRWRDRDSERTGRARDIDRDGALLVEADGRLERIIAGEVHWEELSRG